MGIATCSPTRAQRTVAVSEPDRSLLGSVSAPKLVFHALAPRLPARSRSANSRRRQGSQWPRQLGLALLELPRSRPAIQYPARLYATDPARWNAQSPVRVRPLW